MMYRSPWDTNLWNQLAVPCANPLKVDGQIVRENLANRKSHRLMPCEKSGSDENPDRPAPPSGDWTGDYQDAPCVANAEYKAQYKMVFKPDGAVEGSGSSKEGRFKIQGVYNLRSGILAWRQLSPPDAHQGCGTKLAAEFFGSICSIAGRKHITGTFLTNTGRYCVVKLVSPKDSEPVAVVSRLGAVGASSRHFSAEAAALPRLLGSPKKGSLSKRPTFCVGDPAGSSDDPRINDQGYDGDLEKE